MAGPPYGSVLSRLAKGDPDRACLHHEERALTRVQLESLSNRAAAEFAKLGVKAGDLVSIGLPNGVPRVVARFVPWKLGRTQPVVVAPSEGRAGSSLARAWIESRPGPTFTIAERSR